MGAANPVLIGQGPSTTDPNSPAYLFLSVSNLIDRDSEYWIPYATELLKPGTKLENLKPFADCIAQDRVSPVLAKLLGAVPSNRDATNDDPTADPLAPFVFIDVHSDGGKNYLIFARNTPPDTATFMTPSLDNIEEDTWRFPQIMRKFPQPQFAVDSQNLISVTVKPDIVPAYQGICQIRVRQWWTAEEWPGYLMYSKKMQPTIVRWNYFNLPGGVGEDEYLHGQIDVPPLTGINAVRGQSLGRVVNIQGKRFPASDPPTWINDVMYNKPQQIRGRWFREMKEVLPPSNPAVYPKSPFFYTS